MLRGFELLGRRESGLVAKRPFLEAWARDAIQRILRRGKGGELDL